MRIKLALLALLAGLFALPSRADSIDYSLKNEFFPDEMLTFSLPVNPVPTSADSTGFSIQFESGVFDGEAHTFDVFMDATDFTVVLDEIPNLPVILANLHGSNMPLFSGNPTHPTLLAGTFRFSSDIETTVTAKLVSSTTPVPEPSSLYLLAAGMIALFFKFRR
jgi:hypothetical protein